MTKVIALTQGKVALVDDADFEWLNQWKWYAFKDPRVYYARRNSYENGKVCTIQMHRAILNPPLGSDSDHINGNGLDNRRTNLRVCTHAENCQNRRKPTGCSSRYKGVSWRKRTRKWRAYIWINGRQKQLGCFDEEEEAARAYNKEALEQFREFAQLNVIPAD
ncbi:unnamed protein product [marine sediment metagenome]|uniref:AP2/ERF domain-containing protein n=1 Tax=marine sediment metagenome TaxID=412755 RepID=X1T734_9ZZZZ